MPRQANIAVLTVAVALSATVPAPAADQAKLPGWTGQWTRAHERSQWDPSKPRGLAQEAPLNDEYLEIFKANLAQLKSSGQGVDPQLRCIPSGTPRMMMGYEPLEVIVTPEATYIRVDHLSELRRIFTSQLEAYAKVLRNLHGADAAVRAGLYYPRMMLLDSWEL